MFKLIFAICLLAFSTISHANWTVDSQNSRLNFISVKKVHIAESHHFKTVTGQLTAQGKFELVIDLSSLETGIAIRNTRMQQHLFITDKFATAKLSAQIDPALINGLKVATPTSQQITATLLLNGVSKELSVTVMITKLDDNTMVINSLNPIIVNATDFMLSAGIDVLRDLAKLANISYAVPVTFNLRLVK